MFYEEKPVFTPVKPEFNIYALKRHASSKQKVTTILPA